jgi:ketosteroid isomerase-like protein
MIRLLNIPRAQGRARCPQRAAGSEIQNQSDLPIASKCAKRPGVRLSSAALGLVTPALLRPKTEQPGQLFGISSHICHSSFVLCLFVLLSLSACSTNPSSPGVTSLPITVTDQAPSRQALRDADVAFAKLSEKKGAAQAFYQFLAPGGTVLFPGEMALEGREVVRIHLATGPQRILTWKPDGAEVSQNGDLGYTWGTFESRAKTPEDKPQISYGKYLSVWKKEPESSWRIILHANNPSPPPNSRR